jgi:hypothetical protein
MSNVSINRPEYIDLLRKFATETSAQILFKYIDQEIVKIEPDELTRLISITKISFKDQKCRSLLMEVLLKKSIDQTRESGQVQ